MARCAPNKAITLSEAILKCPGAPGRSHTPVPSQWRMKLPELHAWSCRLPLSSKEIVDSVSWPEHLGIAVASGPCLRSRSMKSSSIIAFSVLRRSLVSISKSGPWIQTLLTRHRGLCHSISFRRSQVLLPVSMRMVPILELSRFDAARSGLHITCVTCLQTTTVCELLQPRCFLPKTSAYAPSWPQCGLRGLCDVSRDEAHGRGKVERDATFYCIASFVGVVKVKEVLLVDGECAEVIVLSRERV